MDPAHLNKLFSISNWLFLIPCYCQNSIGDFVKHPCSNKGDSSFSIHIILVLPNVRLCVFSFNSQFSNLFQPIWMLPFKPPILWFLTLHLQLCCQVANRFTTNFVWSLHCQTWGSSTSSWESFQRRQSGGCT